MSSLKQDWQEETFYLFENCKCWWCDNKVNEQGHRVDALHHILGRCSNSPLNAAPVHNFSCHLNNGKLSHEETKEEFLLKTLKHLNKIGYNFSKKDQQFLSEHSDYYRSG